MSNIYLKVDCGLELMEMVFHDKRIIYPKKQEKQYGLGGLM